MVAVVEEEDAPPPPNNAFLKEMGVEAVTGVDVLFCEGVSGKASAFFFESRLVLPTLLLLSDSLPPLLPNLRLPAPPSFVVVLEKGVEYMGDDLIVMGVAVAELVTDENEAALRFSVQFFERRSSRSITFVRTRMV